jgi:hypothetical protein
VGGRVSIHDFRLAANKILYDSLLCVCYSAADAGHERAIKETKAERQKHVAEKAKKERTARETWKISLSVETRCAVWI